MSDDAYEAEAIAAKRINRMTTQDWKNLTTLQAVAKAQADGWEIEIQADPGNDKFYPWKRWNEVGWHSRALYRGRPKQPKTRTVTSECWRHKDSGDLTWRDAGRDLLYDWQRFPAGDITGEVTE